jgi:outer membrane receptor protein involved in Fe transport
VSSGILSLVSRGFVALLWAALWLCGDGSRAAAQVVDPDSSADGGSPAPDDPPAPDAAAPPMAATPPMAAARTAAHSGDESSYGASARAQRSAPAELAPRGTGSRMNIPLEELPATAERRARALAVSRPDAVVAIRRLSASESARLSSGQRVRRTARQPRHFRRLCAQAGMLDLERIEVLRGPCSALYGYGAVGGLVNLIHKQPSRDARYELTLGLGLPNQRIVAAGAQGPAGELFSCRFDIGQVTSVDFRGASTERDQVSAAVRFTPQRGHTFNLRVSYARDRYSTDTGIPTEEDPARPGTWHLPPGARYENRYGTANDHLAYQRIDLSADYRFNISRSSYLQARANLVDHHDEYLAAESLTYVPGMPASVDRDYFSFARGWRPIVAQLELHSELATGPIRHKLVAGYVFNWFAGASDGGGVGSAANAMPGSVGSTHPVDNAPPVAFQRDSVDHYRHVTHALYGFDHVHLLDQLILTGGMRLDLIRSRVRRQFIDPELGTSVADPDTGSPRAPISEHVEAVTGQLGLVYTPLPQLITYLSYASSFLPVFIYPSDGSASRGRRAPALRRARACLSAGRRGVLHPKTQREDSTRTR